MKIIIGYLAVIHLIEALSPVKYRKILPIYKTDKLELIAKCTQVTATRLLAPDNRIAIICNKCGAIVNQVVKTLSDSNDVTVSHEDMDIPNTYDASFIVFDSRLSFIRESFIESPRKLNHHEYLLVTKASNKDLLQLVQDFWNHQFRGFAFLHIGVENWGKISFAKRVNGTIKLSMDQDCRDITNSTLNFAREFCPMGSCNVTTCKIYGTMNPYWSEENGLWLEEGTRLPTVGETMVKKFGILYDLNVKEVNTHVTWANATELVTTRALDIVRGGFPPRTERLNGLEIVGTFGSRNMVFAIRAEFSFAEDNVLALLMPFHYFVWVCTILLILIYFFLLFAIRRFWQSGLMVERLTCLQMYAAIVSLSVDSPKKQSLRFIFGLWLIWAFQMNLAYNSTFSSSLTKSGDEDRLVTFQDLAKSSMDIKGPELILEYMNSSDDPVLQELLNKYEILPPTQAVEAMATGKSVAVLQKLTVDRMNWRYRAEPDFYIYTIKESPFAFPTLMYVERGNSLADLMHMFISRGRDIGIIEKWRRVRGNVVDNMQVEVLTDGGILNISHLRMAFTCYGIIVFASWILFFLEFFHLDEKIKKAFFKQHE